MKNNITPLPDKLIIENNQNDEPSAPSNFLHPVLSFFNYRNHFNIDNLGERERYLLMSK